MLTAAAAPPEGAAERQARREQWCKDNPEAQKGMPMVARNFDRIDADKDGVVTLQEIEAARKARAAQRMEKGK